MKKVKNYFLLSIYLLLINPSFASSQSKTLPKDLSTFHLAAMAICMEKESKIPQGSALKYYEDVMIQKYYLEKRSLKDWRIFYFDKVKGDDIKTRVFTSKVHRLVKEVNYTKKEWDLQKVFGMKLWMTLVRRDDNCKTLLKRSKELGFN
tara:strand:+ start:20 stop:466 length:447 start_codon:yes stop_codon:yes gene_type:complete